MSPSSGATAPLPASDKDVEESGQTGFRIVNGLLSVDECDALSMTLSARVSRSRAGARHLMNVPGVAILSRDPRLLELARRELGIQPFPFRATLFEKTRTANWLVVWHQDTALPLQNCFEAPGWGPWSRKAGVDYSHAPAWALERVVALRVYLDESTSNNGPLRVVPQSHLLGVLSDDEISTAVRRRGFEECHVSKGGVLVMRPLIIHSSSKSRGISSRRVLHLEYADSQSLEPGIALAVS